MAGVRESCMAWKARNVSMNAHHATSPTAHNWTRGTTRTTALPENWPARYSDTSGVARATTMADTGMMSRPITRTPRENTFLYADQSLRLARSDISGKTAVMYATARTP